jgi:hypothetical protein
LVGPRLKPELGQLGLEKLKPGLELELEELELELKLEELEP